MFHFPGCASQIKFEIIEDYSIGFPHSEISGSKVARHLPEAYRSYATSFIASYSQGIHRTPLNFLSRNLKIIFTTRPAKISKIGVSFPFSTARYLESYSVYGTKDPLSIEDDSATAFNFQYSILADKQKTALMAAVTENKVCLTPPFRFNVFCNNHTDKSSIYQC